MGTQPVDQETITSTMMNDYELQETFLMEL